MGIRARWAAAIGALLALGAAFPATLMVENFEQEPRGAYPSRWGFLGTDARMYPLTNEMSAQEQFIVEQEGANRFLRLYTRNEAQRITMLSPGAHLRWVLAAHPRFRWRWRALVLPDGAAENRRGRNDVGAAIYVTFSRDLLGRPRSIKYTYSSSLAVGTTFRQGQLRVIVVSSGAEPRGFWRTVERDVVADYAATFGGAAPNPISITLWSDSDDTGKEAKVDLDDLELLPAR